MRNTLRYYFKQDSVLQERLKEIKRKEIEMDEKFVKTHKKTSENWALFLKSGMELMGLSIRKLAKLADISPSYISQIFKGNFKNL